MKYIITENQKDTIYLKYLKYLLGDLIEVSSTPYPKSRFWKNDKSPQKKVGIFFLKNLTIILFCIIFYT